MRIQTSEISGAVVIGISGEIDMDTSPELWKALMGLIKRRPREVVVDCCEVTYMDSSGIATLVEGLKAMRGHNGTLKLAGINDHVMDIIRFAKLDTVFSNYDSVQSALKN